MKYYKKLLAFGLSVVMLAGMTACGGSDDKPAASDNNNTPAASGNNSSGNDDNTSADNSDGGNTVGPAAETRTIRIGTWYDHFYDRTN